MHITLTLALVALVAASPADHLTIENERLTATIDVARGGRVIALTDRQTGIGLTAIPQGDAAAGAGLLNDRLWGRRQVRNLETSPYEVIASDAHSVSLRIAISTPADGAFVVDKTIALPAGRHAMTVDYAVSNIGAAPWEGRLWIANLLRPDSAGDQPLTFSYPTGRLHPTLDRGNAGLTRPRIDYLPGGTRMPNAWISDPHSGWAAVTRPDGAGAAMTVDGGYVDVFYSCQPPGVTGGEKLATCEVLFGPLALQPTDDDDARDKLGIPPLVGMANPGKPFRTRIEFVPLLPGTGRIIDARDGLVRTAQTDAGNDDEPAPVARKTDFQPAVDFPEIDEGPASPHVPWFKPLVKRPRLLLVLTDRSRRDLKELTQRFDADIDVVVIAFPHYFTYHASPQATDPYRVLSHDLAKEHDAIVLGGGIHWSILPDKDREAIIRKVKAGTGLLYIAPRAGDQLFADTKITPPVIGDLLGGEPLEAESRRLVQGVPRASVPVFRSWPSLAERIRVTACGRGNVIVYDAPVWPYGRPYMVRQTLRPFTTREQSDGVEFLFDEYHWLLTLRLIARAAGVDLLDVKVALDADLTAAIELPRPARGATAHVTWLHRRGGAIASLTHPITDDATRITLRPPATAHALPGVALVHVIVRDAEGRSIAAAAGETLVQREPVLAALRTLKFGHAPGDPVRGAATIRGPVAAGATLALRVTDMRGRRVAEQTIPVGQVAVVAAASPSSVTDNLAPNGSFELDAVGTVALPAGWARAAGNQSDMLQIEEGARPDGAGRRMLKINTSADRPTAGVHSPMIPLNPRKPLTVTGWVKAGGENIAGAGAYLGVHWYDADRKPIPLRDSSGQNYIYVISAMRRGEWTRREHRFEPAGAPAASYLSSQVPHNAAFFELRAFVLEYPAAVWFDDLSAEQPSDSPATVVAGADQTLPFQLRPDTGLTQLHRIDADLLDADGNLLDARWCEYTIDLPAPKDVVFQVWGPNNVPGTVSGELEIDAIVNTGFDFATVNASSVPPDEVRAYGLGLMRRGLRMMPMTLMPISATHKSLGAAVRDPCLTDPAHRRHQQQHLESYTRLLHDLFPPAYFNGDENSLGSYSSPHDFCQSSTCLARFRGYLEDKYRSIGRFNVESGESFASFDEVRPPTLAEARQAGRWPLWIEHRAYMPSVLADEYAFMHLVVKQGRPNAALATSGMGRPSLNNGFDWPQLMPHLNHAALYARQHQFIYRSELFRSYLNPHATIGTWTGYGASQTFVRDSIWWEILSGMNAPAYYASLEHLCTFSMGHSDDAVTLARDIAEVKSGIGKLIMGGTRLSDPIVIHHSYLSAVALESIRQRDGGPIDFNAYYAALDGYVHLLHELGYQVRFVDRRELDSGRAALDDCKVLIMPMAHALSDSEVAAARRFVDAGGTLIADPAFGFLTDAGKPANRTDLADWLGLTALDQKFTWINDQRPAAISRGRGQVVTACAPIGEYSRRRAGGRERILRDDLAAALSAAGLAPAVTVDAGPGIGPALWGGEVVRFTLGEGELLSLRRNAEVEGNARPASTEITVRWDRPRHVYNVRRGEYLGESDVWTGELPMGDMVLLALLPEKLGPLEAAVSFDAVGRGGEAAIQVRRAGGDRLVVNLSVFDPSGRAMPHLSRNEWLSNGSAVVPVPLALNDSPGRWRALLREVVSGQTAEVVWQVK